MLLHVKFTVAGTVPLVFIDLWADQRETVAKTGEESVRVEANAFSM